MTLDLAIALGAFLVGFILTGTAFVIRQEKAKKRAVAKWDAIADYYASQHNSIDNTMAYMRNYERATEEIRQRIHAAGSDWKTL